MMKAWGDWTLFQELLAVLRSIADRHGGVSIANVATRWVLDQPAVGAVIIGECSISLFLSFTPVYCRSFLFLITTIPPPARHVIFFFSITFSPHHHHISNHRPPSTRSNRPDLDRFYFIQLAGLSVLSRRPHGNRRTQGRQQESVQLLVDYGRQGGHSSRFGQVERRQAHSDDR